MRNPSDYVAVGYKCEFDVRDYTAYDPETDITEADIDAAISDLERDGFYCYREGNIVRIEGEIWWRDDTADDIRENIECDLERHDIYDAEVTTWAIEKDDWQAYEGRWRDYA